MSETVSEVQASSSVPRRGTRWLLLGSLALNLFFIGIAVAMVLRGPPPHRYHNVFERVERLTATLPPADGQIVTAAMNTNHAAIAKAQDELHSTRDAIGATLRQEPFKEDAMRAALAKARAARQAFDQLLGNIFVKAATEMSPAGRQALADWPHRHRREKKPN